MDKDKKEIRAACKRAQDYNAWRNPVHTWFVTLLDEKGNGFFEFQYNDINLPRKDVTWIDRLLSDITNRRIKTEVK